MGLKILFNNSLYKTSHSIININLSLKNVNQYNYLNEITRIINEEIKLYLFRVNNIYLIKEKILLFISF